MFKMGSMKFMGVISVVLGQIEKFGGFMSPPSSQIQKLCFHLFVFVVFYPFLKLYVCPKVFSGFDRLMCLVKHQEAYYSFYL